MKMNKPLLGSLVWMCVLAGCGDSDRGTPMQFEQMPISVRRGVESAYPDSRVYRVRKIEDEKTGAVQYEVGLIAKDGKERKDVFAADGQKIVKE